MNRKLFLTAVFVGLVGALVWLRLARDDGDVYELARTNRLVAGETYRGRGVVIAGNRDAHCICVESRAGDQLSLAGADAEIGRVIRFEAVGVERNGRVVLKVVTVE